MNNELAQAISNVVASIGAAAPSLTSAARTWTLYEAFTLCCLVEALSQLGAQFEVHDQDDTPTGTLVLRTKPGLLYSRDVPYTFIVARASGREYEIHSDVRVVGRSKVLHEIDVALLDRAEGIRCRQAQVSPRQAKVRFLAECKFYGEALPLRIGREFLGLSSECTPRAKTIVSNVGSDSVHRMIVSHKGTANFEVSPMTPARVGEFVSWIATELRQVLR